MKSNKLQIFLLNIIVFIFIVASLFFIGLQEWISMHFGNVTIDQILFTMMLPLKGTSSSIYISFVKHFIFPVCVASAVLITIFIFIEDIKYFNKAITRRIKDLILIFFIFVLLLLIIVSVFPTKTNKFYNSKNDSDFIVYNLSNKNSTNPIFLVRNNKDIVENFKDRTVLEIYSIDEYKENIEKGIMNPSLLVYEYENFKDVLRYNIKIISVDEPFFDLHKNMFKYFHKKKLVVIVHTNSINKNLNEFIRNNLGVSCSMICIDNREKND